MHVRALFVLYPGPLYIHMSLYQVKRWGKLALWSRMGLFWIIRIEEIIKVVDTCIYT